MTTDKEVISKAYDAGVEQEDRRLSESPLKESEFILISELLDEYIADGSTVIDIGAGTGRYTDGLLQRHCKVGAVDLSEKSLSRLRHRVNGNYGNRFLFTEKACATDLSWIDDDIADAVILMGPLYHLVGQAERDKAIAHAYRILKPGGVIFSLFMSPYPKLNPVMEVDTETLLDLDYIDSIQYNGVTSVLFNGFRIEQYRCWPAEGKRMMEEQGFITERLRNIEGIGDFLSLQMINCHDKTEKTKLLNSKRRTCENPNLLGTTSQYLYVGRRE